MTIERAIEILDPEHRERYDGLDEVNEACRMGMEALRIVQLFGSKKILCGQLLDLAENIRLSNQSPARRAIVLSLRTRGVMLEAAQLLELAASFSGETEKGSDVPSMPVFPDWDTIHRESGLLEG